MKDSKVKREPIVWDEDTGDILAIRILNCVAGTGLTLQGVIDQLEYTKGFLLKRLKIKSIDSDEVLKDVASRRACKGAGKEACKKNEELQEN